MPASNLSSLGEVHYARELGPRQAVVLGLRTSLPVVAFLALGLLTDRAGRGAPLALLLGALIWLPTVLSYLEMTSRCAESGIYEVVAQYRSGILPFLATWTVLLIDLLAAGLLARQLSKLAWSWLVHQLPAPITNLMPGGLAVLALAVALMFALRRRRPWHRNDEWVVLGGILAIVLTAFSAALVPRPSPVPASLPALTFEHLLSGALPFILGLLAVEAIGEWKAELRQSQRVLVRVTSVALAILVASALALLVAGLRIDATVLAGEGLAALLSTFPLGPLAISASLLFALSILMAISALLLQASRLSRQLVREGFLPRPRIRNSRHSAAVGMVLLAVLAAAPILLPAQVATSALVGMVLVYALFINSVAILLRSRAESESLQDGFSLPFPPLVPALGLAITLFLALMARPAAYAGMAVALAAGGLAYLLYGHTAHRQAQETRTVFRARQRQPEATPERFRVLVPLLGTPAEHRALLTLAQALVQQLDGEVLALQIVSVPPQQTRAEGARLASESQQLLQWSLGEGAERAPITPLTRIGRDPVHTIIDTARSENCDLILITWRPAHVENGRAFARGNAVQRSRVVGDLVRGAPCMVAALDGVFTHEVKRILVPTAGGPHAPVAAQLALQLARAWDAQVIGLNIVRDGENPEALAQARRWVLDTFAGLEGGEEIEVRVVPSEKPIAAALVEEADAGCELVMIGASNESLLDRVLFGDIPQQVAEGTETPAVMVRAARPVREAWMRLLWDRAQAALPALDAEDQIELYRTLRRGARPNVNFFVLILLSALIATIGLWQNSAAVIIGAMLVAPLMTPILATSLGIVLGEARMIRVAAEATVKGVAAGIGIALFVTVILPDARPGGEIMARTQPTFLDLVVALASGAAGAYAVARKEVSAALPGVAIAAALMPPLCTAGIGLAIFDGQIAGGALLLFTTNLVAITVAAGLVFLLLGMRPRRREQARRAHFRRGLLIALAMLVIISLPLTWLGMRNVVQARNERLVAQWLSAAVEASAAAELSGFTVEQVGQTLVVHARVLHVGDALDSSQVDAWSDLLARKTGHPVSLTVDVQSVDRLTSESGK